MGNRSPIGRRFPTRSGMVVQTVFRRARRWRHRGGGARPRGRTMAFVVDCWH